MEKIALNSKLVSVNGKPIMEPDNNAQVTLRTICIQALLAPVQGVPATEKFWRASMAITLRDAGAEVYLNGDEIKRLRDIVGEAFPQPEVVQQAWLYLTVEAKPNESKAKLKKK